MFKRVSEEDFYKNIGEQDVVLSVKEPYPYKIEFRLRQNNKLVGYEDRDGTYYYLNQ